ncbi:MAG: zinc ribbon domain-containing protein [Bacillota bacterium]
MEKLNLCQSCGMTIAGADGLYGTNSDGSINKKYCKFCYSNGEFTADVTLEEMITAVIPHVLKANPDMSKAEAKEMLENLLPTLERWQ